ncbi:MAG: metal ABC transporter ATP-binding protein [Clostridiaceae bacterium]|nr:metal ABC transporter ATP-binding protein [Clostridiaceae bacterium]
MQTIIDIKDLSFSYPSKKDVLKKINIKVEKGKFTCIVGENGSGKSTLLKCIVGLNKGYTGQISIDEKVGYLPQKTEIQTNFPASIEEVVLSGTISNNINSIFYKKDDKEKASRIMKELGIYDIRKKSFIDLSGGQQQRVLIARAMCATEKTIILDEPTNGLDPKVAKQIYEMLDKLKKEKNLSILMVSHDIDRALKYTDKVIEIENGEIKYNGDTNNYLTGGDIK